MLGKISLAAIAVVAAALGASSVNPRELYNEMYPVEAMKRDAFHICRDANPAFIRAVKGDREACFDSMPHLIAVALGRVRPSTAVAMAAALLDPSHQAELLLTLAAMPPRQPITVPKSFANTAWMRALSSGCEDKATASARTTAPAATARVAGRASTLPANLPGLPQAAGAGAARPPALPVIPLAGNAPGRGAGEQVAASNEPAVADLGDQGPPAIVPLAAAGNCGGA